MLCLLLSGILSFIPAPAFAQMVQTPTEGNAKFRTGHMPYKAFETLPKTTLKMKGATFEIGFAPGKMNLTNKQILNWLENSAHIVTKYYDRFPVKNVKILIVPNNGQGIQGGQTFGYRGAAIRLFVGKNSSEVHLKRDWVAIHEMIHLALPQVKLKHYWLAEGLAVYVESIARVQAGQLNEQQIWADFMRDMPKGLPGEYDKGLDYTPTWGRRYWGGAMFCLLADIEIRKQTNNKKGLQHALKAIISNGGNYEKHWPIEKILTTADQATGTNVLSSLYKKMHNAPTKPDLDALWSKLGISKSKDKIIIDDNAPLSPIRKAIITKDGTA